MKKYKSQFFSTRFNRYKIPVKPPYKFLSITLNFYMKFCMNESMNRKIKNYVCTDFFDPTILLSDMNSTNIWYIHKAIHLQ